MANAIEYPPMLTPMAQCEPGSAEYFLCGSYLLEHTVDSGDRYTISEIVELLEKMFDDSFTAKPWDLLPVGKPWRSAAPWIEQVFHGSWKELRPVLEKKSQELVRRLDAEMHPGNPGKNMYKKKGMYKEKGASVNNNVINDPPRQGNSREYTMNRLKREAPELFERVVAGELTANKAAIEAGFRKKPTPLEQIQKLLPKLSDEDLATLRLLIRVEAPTPRSRSSRARLDH